jgi:hypothetical protein
VFEADPILKLVSSLGIGIVLAIALWYALLVPRRDKNGRPRSSLLVPGWKHDQDMAECRQEVERTRKFYADALKDEQERSMARVQEWRALRDETIAAKKDSDSDSRELLGIVTSASKDISLLLELQRMASRDGRQPRTPSG